MQLIDMQALYFFKRDLSFRQSLFRSSTNPSCNFLKGQSGSSPVRASAGRACGAALSNTRLLERMRRLFLKAWHSDLVFDRRGIRLEQRVPGRNWYRGNGEQPKPSDHDDSGEVKDGPESHPSVISQEAVNG